MASNSSAVAAVLDNPLLRQKIIDFAIFRRNDDFPWGLCLWKREATSTACTLRLVQRNWLHSVMDCFYTRIELSSEGEESPYMLSLRISWDTVGPGENPGSILGRMRMFVNKWIGGLVRREDNCSTSMEAFTALMTNENRVDSRILPFTLFLAPTFFVERNHKHFQDLLAICGEGLVKLELWFPCSVHTMPAEFPPLELPNMKVMAIDWVDWSMDSLRLSPTDVGSISTWEVVGEKQVKLVQHIINGACNLLSFKVSSRRPLNERFVPEAFSHLLLPGSLTSLMVTFTEGVAIRSEHLKQWIRLNKLDRLKYLYFHMDPETSVEVGLMFEMLSKCRHTLDNLYVKGYRVDRGGGGDMLDQSRKLPVMERLKALNVDSCLDLPPFSNPSAFRNWQGWRPKLEVFRLSTSTPTDLDNWAATCDLGSVTMFSVRVTTDIPRDDLQHDISLTPEQLQKLQIISPNVTILELFVSGPDTAGLELIFREMVSLKELDIGVDIGKTGDHTADPILGGFWDHIVDPIDWNALLIGCTPEMAKALEEEYVEHGTLDGFVEREDIPSIRNMTNLRSLSIMYGRTLYVGQRPTAAADADGFLSDIAFPLALFKMDNLTELSLSTVGKGKVSQKIRDEWKMLKGSDIYYSNPN